MRYMVTVAAAALMSAGAAQAAVVDLTYTVEAQITSVQDSGQQNADVIESLGGYEFTREVGDIEFYTFEVRADTEKEFGERAVFGPGGFGDYSLFDPSNGSGSFYYGNADEAYSFFLRSDGTGSLSATIASAPEISSFFIWEYAQYDVLSWSVDGLPAPVPLPASLPLLMVGIGAVGVAARRSKRAV